MLRRRTIVALAVLALPLAAGAFVVQERASTASATLFDLAELQIELESLLGVRVDLRTPGDLSLKFRAAVVAQASAV